MPENIQPGIGVDAAGNQVIDPTKNVLDLVTAAIDRQDDLRAAQIKLTKAEHKHLREIIVLRAEERKGEIKNLHTLERMRAAHARELRLAEADRIDAIRAVDNQAVQQAAIVSATQATTLAAQVSASAEAMRVQVAATANASAIALSNALEPITKAIEELRRSQYEAQGVRGAGLDARSALTIVILAISVIATIIIQLVK